MIKPCTCGWRRKRCAIFTSCTRIVLTLVGIVISTASVVAIPPLAGMPPLSRCAVFPAWGQFVCGQQSGARAGALYADMEAEKHFARALSVCARCGGCFLYPVAPWRALRRDAVLYCGKMRSFDDGVAAMAAGWAEAGVWVGLACWRSWPPARPGPDVGLRLRGVVTGGRGSAEPTISICGYRRAQCGDFAGIHRHLFPALLLPHVDWAPAAGERIHRQRALRGYFVQRGCRRGIVYPAKIIESLKPPTKLFAWLLAGVALISVVVAVVGGDEQHVV